MKRKGQMQLLRKRGREWRIDRLVAVLRFAYSNQDSARLIDEVSRLSSEIGAIEWEISGFPGNPNEAAPIVKEMQKKLRDGLELLRDGHPGDTWELPKIGRYVEKIGDIYMSKVKGRADEAFLHKCVDLLTGPDGWRLMRCAESDCRNLIVKRKKGTFCTEHGTSAARSDRFHKRMDEILSPVEKRRRRRELYELHMKRKGVPAAVIRASHERWRSKETGGSNG